MNRKHNFIKILGMAIAIGTMSGSLPTFASPAASTQRTILAQMDANVLFNRGVQKIQQEDYQGAIADFSALIEREPENANAYLGRAIAYRNQGNYQEAIENYDESLRLNPANPNAYLGRGICKRRMGDDRAAIEDYTTALRYNENSGQAYYNRGLSKVELGDREGALADFRKAAELYRAQELTQYYQDALDRIADLEGVR
jgi:tetratricopeptide (TPR) repeat protein